jgi:hypothetical protein
LALNGLVAPYPCSVVEEETHEKGEVPSWMPGKNPDLHEYADKHKIPFDATRGGPQTMYPEYISNMSGANASPVGRSRQ